MINQMNAHLRQYFTGLAALLLCVTGAMSSAQELPPCFERSTFRDPPWVDGTRYCVETVIRDPLLPEPGFTALAAAPDGTLFAAVPVLGQIWAFTDSDGDGLPDQPHVIANNLTMPNGLAYHDNTLYIAGGRYLYRLAGDAVEILADDVPLGSSGWGGSVIVGPDERLYVSVSASCDFCVPEQAEHGAILSYALDGSDRALVATGLRQAADMAFFGGDLWATDSARFGLGAMPDLDELNRVRWGAHLGWPFCVGAGRQPDMVADNIDCDSTTPPELTFPTGSTPLGMAAYTDDTLPDLTNTLLVVLNGSRNRVDLQGYALAAVQFDESGRTVDYAAIIPAEPNDRFTTAQLNYRISGLWPYRPLDVAVSTEGWIYLSISGGQIIAVRPV
jgi:glucose/arabinose dehydrogenase